MICAIKVVFVKSMILRCHLLHLPAQILSQKQEAKAIFSETLLQIKSKELQLHQMQRCCRCHHLRISTASRQPQSQRRTIYLRFSVNIQQIKNLSTEIWVASLALRLCLLPLSSQLLPLDITSPCQTTVKKQLPRRINRNPRRASSKVYSSKTINQHIFRTSSLHTSMEAP